DRLTQPLIRKDGRLTPATWEEAFELVGKKLAEIRDTNGGGAIGVIGSNRTTNEENYLLQKFARVVLKTNNIDHHRTADFPAFAAALAGKDGLTASMRDVATAPAILLIGNNPTDQHPLLAWQIRNAVRLHGARLYVINSKTIKLSRQAVRFSQVAAGAEGKIGAFLAGDDSAVSGPSSGDSNHDSLTSLRDKLRGEQNLVIIFGSEIRGKDIALLVQFGSALQGAKFVCLSDYANSRGAADMGLYPDLLPGYQSVSSASKFREEWQEMPSVPGLTMPEMLNGATSGKLKALYVVGANPVDQFKLHPTALAKSFVIVQDMFLTETAAIADVVLPASNAYEKSGTFTNTCGDIQLVKKAGEVSGAKSDFEMIVRIADATGYDVPKLVPFGRGTRADMGQSRGAQSGEADRHSVWLEARGLEPKMSPFDPVAILDEIQRLLPSYDISRLNLMAGNDEHTKLSGPGALHDPALIVPANDDLFSSGTLGRYSRTLNSVLENHHKQPAEEIAAD
ncbi:MAG: molybdopterin-dependent oxidoreductase, partial [Acidobacteriaceae bacterium]